MTKVSCMHCHEDFEAESLKAHWEKYHKKVEYLRIKTWEWTWDGEQSGKDSVLMRDPGNNGKIVSMSPALFSQLSQRTEEKFLQNIPPKILKYRLEVRRPCCSPRLSPSPYRKRRRRRPL